MADTRDLKSLGATHAGSSPASGTEITHSERWNAEQWARIAVLLCYNIDDGDNAGEPAKFARFGACAV